VRPGRAGYDILMERRSGEVELLRNHRPLEKAVAGEVVGRWCSEGSGWGRGNRLEEEVGCGPRRRVRGGTMGSRRTEAEVRAGREVWEAHRKDRSSSLPRHRGRDRWGRRPRMDATVCPFYPYPSPCP